MKKLRCLLIDDDTDDQEMFKDYLCDFFEDIECESASSGKEGMKILISKSSDILPDVIFLDVHMPVMDGIEFLRQERQYSHLKPIPVVVTSTTLSEKDKGDLTGLGVHEFFEKPSSAAEWKQQLELLFVRLSLDWKVKVN